MEKNIYYNNIATYKKYLYQYHILFKFINFKKKTKKQNIFMKIAKDHKDFICLCANIRKL